jgi:hypothetical protein
MVRRRQGLRRPNGLRLALAAFAACAIAAALPRAAAAQARFAGDWVIARAVAAPWAHDPKDAADEADARRLVGQRLVIGEHRFQGPRPLGCVRPSFAFRDAAADTLFEGGLNADGADRPTDPAAVARALGMTGKTVRGMTASCSEVEFFLIGPDTMLFGLNNRVFTVQRAR